MWNMWFKLVQNISHFNMLLQMLNIFQDEARHWAVSSEEPEHLQLMKNQTRFCVLHHTYRLCQLKYVCGS